MIYIQRDRTDNSGEVICPNDDWFTLAAEATQDAISEGESHQVRASVYGHTQVRIALEELFYGKCAYCESVIRNQDWDVEHYRPKARVAERENHPGYYWLAYQWKNFYPSCKFCNQRRTDKPTWGDLSRAGAGGKADQFPIEDEDDRATIPDGDISLERPLLLDPCADNPEEFLRFDPTGQIYSKGDNERGKFTIDICFLKRRRLRDLRRDVILRVIELLLLIQVLGTSGNINAVADIQNHLQTRYLDDVSPYAAVSRYIVAHPEEFGL